MSNSAKSYFYAGLTVAFWSTVATAFKIALEHLDVFQLIFVASLAASIVLLVPIVVTKQLPLLLDVIWRHLPRTLATALLNPVVYYLVLFAAYDRLPAQIAQPVNYTWALVLVLLSMFVLKQRPTKFDIAACIVSYGGVVVIATQGRLDFAGTDAFGMALALVSTVIWASYWVLNIADPRDERVSMCANFVLAVPLTAVICGYFSDFELPVKGVLAGIYIGVFEMGLAFLLWAKALKLAENTSRVSTLIFLSPFVSLVLISVVLGEVIQLTTYAGLVIIITGLLIQRWPLLRQHQSLS